MNFISLKATRAGTDILNIILLFVIIIWRLYETNMSEINKFQIFIIVNQERLIDQVFQYYES